MVQQRSYSSAEKLQELQFSRGGPTEFQSKGAERDRKPAPTPSLTTLQQRRSKTPPIHRSVATQPEARHRPQPAVATPHKLGSNSTGQRRQRSSRCRGGGFASWWQ